MKKSKSPNHVIRSLKLDELRNSLPPGALKIIAKNAQCSPDLVSKVLNGKRSNLNVIKEAIKYKKSINSEIEVLNNEIKKVI